MGCPNRNHSSAQSKVFAQHEWELSGAQWGGFESGQPVAIAKLINGCHVVIRNQLFSLPTPSTELDWTGLISEE